MKEPCAFVNILSINGTSTSMNTELASSSGVHVLSRRACSRLRTIEPSSTSFASTYESTQHYHQLWSTPANIWLAPCSCGLFVIHGQHLDAHKDSRDMKCIASSMARSSYLERDFRSKSSIMDAKEGRRSDVLLGARAHAATLDSCGCWAPGR
jgi:hypothetical protein